MAVSVSIFDLTALGAAPASNDVTVLVDVSDTTQSPQGTTKKITIADLFTSVTITTSLTVTGTATVSSTLGVTGNFSVATNKFVVTAATGNTAIAGDVAVNTNKFTVAASSGNTLVAGTLGVTGLITGSLKSVTGDTFSVLQQPTTPTQGAFFQFINTGGTLDIGLENSAGSLFGTAGAYGTVIYRPASTAFAISRTSTVDLLISSAGLATFGASVVVGASSTVSFSGRSLLKSASDGNLAFRNNADGADSNISAANGVFSGTLTSIGAQGFATGAGGTVTQGSGSGRATAVTLNKVCGQITTENSTSLGAGGVVTFTVNNTTVAATDTILLSIASGTTSGNTLLYVSAVAANSFNIRVYNASAGAETGAIVINFCVLKGVTS